MTAAFYTPDLVSLEVLFTIAFRYVLLLRGPGREHERTFQEGGIDLVSDKRKRTRKCPKCGLKVPLQTPWGIRKKCPLCGAELQKKKTKTGRRRRRS
jgi:endogenous inhibitor of DNA gyrase (YacG/DUF329 family)